MKHIYAVGSLERHLVVDRVFDKKKHAISYCDSRRCVKYDWAVFKAPFGAGLLDWKLIHRTPHEDKSLVGQLKKQVAKEQEIRE